MDDLKQLIKRDGDDPVVMYILVHEESNISAAVEQAAQAARQALYEAETSNDENVLSALSAWKKGSYRKVTLKVPANRWDEITAREDAFGKGLVRAVLPMAKSKRDKTIKRLQSLKNLSGSILEWPDRDLPQVLPGELDLGVNLSLGMSAGKLIAQVAHAAANAPGEWQDIVNVWGIPRNRWDLLRKKLPQKNSLMIHDAGITEIAQGSPTVWAHWT